MLRPTTFQLNFLEETPLKTPNNNHSPRTHFFITLRFLEATATGGHLNE